MAKKTASRTPSTFRTPVVAVLGHVDHGKTTLLDYIRKTSVVQKEFGGITQHIGAYQIEFTPLASKAKEKRTITFIDTPGHEAFAKMRGRGVESADIAILVVAANDGVKPQTLESIQHIKKANIPLIVAINKIDLPDAIVEKVKKQLVQTKLALEEYGGEVPVVSISAKTGVGIEKLLDMIVFLSDFNQLVDTSQKELQAVIIESRLSKQKGPVATIVVKSGTLRSGQDVFCEGETFRVRALFDWLGKSLQEVKVGDPCEILGFKNLPPIGGVLTDKPLGIAERPSIVLAPTEEIHIQEEKITMILKADAAGSLEAITSGLKDNTEVILKGVGHISESDVLLAKTTRAIIIGFNVDVSENIKKLALSEKVHIKTYRIIYDLFREMDEVIEALRKGNLVSVLGEAEIKAVFTINNEHVAGVVVSSGRIARGDQVKILRKETELGRSRIRSLRHLKEDVTKVEQGTEAGVILAQNIDFLTGDSIIAID